MSAALTTELEVPRPELAPGATHVRAAQVSGTRPALTIGCDPIARAGHVRSIGGLLRDAVEAIVDQAFPRR